MGIHFLDIYRSPNIGVFLRINDEIALVPRGLAATKTEKLSTLLGVRVIKISMAGTRLLGPLIAMNNRGILITRLAEDEEIATLRRETGLRVERVPSKYTSIGNLLAVNDHGAIASPLLSIDAIQVAQETLEVTVATMTLANYHQTGSVIAATNQGAVVHPRATEREVSLISQTLSVDAEPASINGGVPFVTSGLVANSRNVVVGNITTGPELMILSRAFKV